MATTESMMNSSLAVQDNPESMEMGTSPYPVDDIEFDLEDDMQYADDNSMLDDAPASIDLMHAETDTAQLEPADDHMYDETFDEEIVLEDEPEKVDLEMNAGEHDNVEDYDFDTEDHHDPEIHTVDDNDTRDQNDQAEVVETSTEQIHEPELVDEEDTNTQDHSLTDLDQLQTGYIEEPEYDDPQISQPNASELPFVEEIQTSDPTKEVEEQLEASTTNPEEVSTVAETIEAKSQQGLVTAETNKSSDNVTQPRSPTPAEIHPVTVEYDGNLHSLFPHSHQSSDMIVLLEDPALALLPIDSLLKELHKPVVDYLGHEDEIVLDIPSLGLHICEDSKYATELTLSQIIDTYMMLSQNQALGHIEPLHCQLSHRTCLKTQMQYLVDSARGGKTYAEIVEEHLGSPDQANQQEADTFDEFAAGEEIPEEFDENENAIEPGLATIEAENENMPETEAVADFHQGDTVHIYEEDALEEQHEDEAVDIPQDLQQPVEDEEVNGVDTTQAGSAETQGLTIENEPTSVSKDEHGSPANNNEEDEAEDLFADDVSDDGVFNGKENGVPQENALPVDFKESVDVDPDNFDFDEWDKEAELEDSAAANKSTTPSENSNSKRKADETDDEFDIEYTPQTKKTRSS